MWRKRYAHIRQFERLLVDEGTAIVKLFLHISAEEQRERLQDRIDSPDERWKFRLGDLDDRKLWPKYMKAYRDALARTSTPRRRGTSSRATASGSATSRSPASCATPSSGSTRSTPKPEEGIEGVVVT